MLAKANAEGFGDCCSSERGPRVSPNAAVRERRVGVAGFARWVDIPPSPPKIRRPEGPSCDGSGYISVDDQGRAGARDEPIAEPWVGRVCGACDGEFTT